MVRYKPRVGDLLVHTGGQRVLVGDVNELGGTCDDCKDAPWEQHSRVVPPLDERGRGKLDVWQELEDGWRVDRNLLEGL